MRSSRRQRSSSVQTAWSTASSCVCRSGGCSDRGSGRSAFISPPTVALPHRPLNGRGPRPRRRRRPPMGGCPIAISEPPLSGRLVAMPLSATRTLVLIPVAIALNIVLGSTVQQVLKLPIYLDSVGTIVTGVLAGPLAGLVTGVLTNLIWAYVLPAPLAAPTAGPFAITAGVIGLLAGLWGWLGFFRSRRSLDPPVLVAAIGVALAVALVIAYTFTHWYASTAVLRLSEVAFTFVVAVYAGLVAW